ncbi:hypothetical protein [Microcella frigidaquae]|uniref:Uncharacterized protein n=1 Tax=Microcella frigidaquae TaxID=424758 RepID=A0A840X677_9MICO|nr:hypothetical protein [Microcella frigidaquae]MBB5618043.1 hypothetical protein [Microcella frigidaquae]NHN44245.1 hypothetical protein [Microcella frigidaquae]
MSRWFVAMPAAGAASIHGAAAVTATDGGVGAVLGLVAAAELVIAVGVAMRARRLPAPQVISLALVTPVLLWAMLLLIAVTADAPSLASALVTVPLAAASLLGLIAAASAGADARRTRVGARVCPARGAVALAAAVALTHTVAAPAVAAALPAAPASAALPENAPPPAPSIEFGSHEGHDMTGHDMPGHTD